MKEFGGMNWEGITSPEELEAPKIAEQIRWLKHKIEGIPAEAVEDIVEAGEKGLKAYERYKESRKRRSAVEIVDLTFGSLRENKFEAIAIKPRTEHFYLWLISDDNEMARDLPLEKAVQVLREELELRRLEAADKEPSGPEIRVYGKEGDMEGEKKLAS